MAIGTLINQCIAGMEVILNDTTAINGSDTAVIQDVRVGDGSTIACTSHKKLTATGAPT